MKARREGELLAGSWRRSQKWEIAGDSKDEGRSSQREKPQEAEPRNE